MNLISFTITRPPDGSRPIQLAPGDTVVAVHPEVWHTPPGGGMGGEGNRHEGYRVWVMRP